MSFGSADFRAIRDVLVSHAQTLGIFARVNDHEPKNAPGTGVSCSVFGASIAPLGPASGLSSTSGRVEFTAHIFTSADAEPLSGIDPEVAGAACDLIAAWSADFDLGGTVRNIDLLGAHGTALSADPAYITQDGKFFRVMVLTVPCIVNDLFDQEA